MTTAKTKTKLWPPIHRLTYSSGRHGWQVACMLDRRRIRETFGTREEAETRATQIRKMVNNEGTSAFSLPVDIRAEAARAVAKLTPYNATITEAIDHYVEHVLQHRSAPTVATVIAEVVKHNPPLSP